MLVPICSDVSTFFSLSVDAEKKKTMIMVQDKYASSRFVTFLQLSHSREKLVEEERRDNIHKFIQLHETHFHAKEVSIFIVPVRYLSPNKIMLVNRSRISLFSL